MPIRELLHESGRGMRSTGVLPQPFPAPSQINMMEAGIAGRLTVQAATQFCFSFDFDEWASLARTDPRAFEARRLALLEDYLRQFPAPEQRRLRGLQFRIDMERRRARTPMAACVRLSDMMWNSLVGEHGLRNALHLLLNHTPATTLRQLRARPGHYTAQILSFTGPAR